MRVNRLLEITTLLLKRNVIPAKEFAERFNVSTRTIYRDVEELSSAGIPVYMIKGKGGGISLLDTYTFNKTLVSEHESDSLLLALKTLQATQYPEIDNFLVKLETLFNNAASSDWVHIEFSPWGSKPNEENKFIEIRHAILNQKVIRFDYVDAREEKSQRQIEPMQMIFKSQSWYLRGYCTDRKDFRTFRLSRIKNLIVTDTSFKRRDTQINQQQDERPLPKPLTRIKMKFSNEVTHRVYDDFDDELIIKNSDGSCHVTLDLVEDEWVYGFILSYGCYVEILEPEHLRRLITERMKKAIQLYEPLV
jgi:predicted DNA-binding transcriptional regulator YafY